MSRLIQHVSLCMLLNAAVPLAAAQSGFLDQSFGSAGLATPDVSSTPGEFNGQAAAGVSLDAQGRILVVGAASRSSDGSLACTVLRLRPNGTLDTSFAAPRGFRSLNLGLPAYPSAVCGAVRSLDDGRIVVAGGIANASGSDFAAFVAVLTEAGALDTSFSGNGSWTAPSELPVLATSELNSLIEAVLVDSAGRLLVLGNLSDDAQSNPVGMMLRFSLADGALDTAFGNTAEVPGLMQLREVDFPEPGSTRTTAMALDANGRTLILGGAPTRLVLFRLDGDGAIDPSFGFGMTAAGGNGRGFIPNCQFSRSLLIDPQQRWLISCGAAGGIARVLRTLDNGQLDLDFAIGGVFTLPPSDAIGEFGPPLLGLQPDGRIVLAGRYQVGTMQQAVYGQSDAYLMRLLPSGQLDTGYGYNNGFSRLRFDDPSGFAADTRAEQAVALQIDANGAAIIVGDRRTGAASVENVVCRLVAARPDPLFGNGFEAE